MTEGRHEERATSLNRAYARIFAMRQNLSDKGTGPADLKDEYNQLVDRIASDIGEDLSEFRAPDSYVRTLGEIHGVGRHAGLGTMLDLALFKPRIDGLINYLKLLLPEESIRRIGF